MKQKQFEKVICCITASFVILAGLTVVLTPKSASDRGGSLYYQGTGFAAEPNDSLDVLFFGNSDLYSGIIPAELYSDYGFTSYSSGAVKQNIGKINVLLDNALSKQQPKIVVLEVDCLYQKGPVGFQKAGFLFSLFQYHSRWKDLKKRDFITLPDISKGVDPAKGYVFSDSVVKFNVGNYMGKVNAAPAPISKEARRETIRFIEKCRESGAKVVFLELPTTNSWRWAKHNYVAKLAEDYNVDFIDLNKGASTFQFDSSKDFRDCGSHLNVYGAQKATAFVGAYLSKKYPDAIRGNTVTDLSNWNEAVESYKKSIKIV